MSKLNCKPGDLAIVTHGEQAGTIVTCERLVQTGESIFGVKFLDMPYAVWIIDKPLLTIFDTIEARRICLCADSALRPIRDPGDDATDETLLWLPVPTNEAVTA